MPKAKLQPPDERDTAPLLVIQERRGVVGRDAEAVLEELRRVQDRLQLRGVARSLLPRPQEGDESVILLPRAQEPSRQLGLLLPLLHIEVVEEVGGPPHPRQGSYSLLPVLATIANVTARKS